LYDLKEWKPLEGPFNRNGPKLGPRDNPALFQVSDILTSATGRFLSSMPEPGTCPRNLLIPHTLLQEHTRHKKGIARPLKARPKNGIVALHL
jgi:hypothetical protein